MKLKLTAAFILGAATMAGCASGDDATGDGLSSSTPVGIVTLLAPADFQSSIAGNDVFVVNVHIPYEGEIDGTDALIPFDEIEDHATELPADKSAPLYIYCRSGRMSAEATPDLQRLGYINIIDLAGGMQAWETVGLLTCPRSLVHS
jgi:rhodanese-related sulfurtransferase